MNVIEGNIIGYRYKGGVEYAKVVIKQGKMSQILLGGVNECGIKQHSLPIGTAVIMGVWKTDGGETTFHPRKTVHLKD